MTARTWSFALDFPKPLPGLSANDRCHWSTKADSTATVRLLVKHRAADIPKLAKVRVDVEWVVADRRRRDTDNLAPLLKAIYDGLGADKGTSAHIVVDDAPQYMEKVGATIRYEKGATAHFLITVTEVTA